MRFYLDNWKSVKNKPNENQGRELLELHTVGRAAGYTEAMVKDSAKLLSGYTVDWGTTFAVTYDPNKHTTGAVQVLDFTHPNASADGQAATLAYLKYLAQPPGHREEPGPQDRHLLRLATTRPPGWSTRWPTAYLASGTDIKAVLRALSVHPEFLTSEGLKVRTPIADLVATARVLDVDVQAPSGDNSYTRHANWTHGSAPMFSWPRPDGPPVTGRMWSSASRVFASLRDAHEPRRWLVAEGSDVPDARASWLPAASIRFDEYVDHLCKTWLGRASDAPAPARRPARPDRACRPAR